MALVSVLSDADLRRSEAAALRWADLSAEPDGSGWIRMRRSKGDQEGEGAVEAITPAAMADLANSAAFTDASPEAPVFGLPAASISHRIVAVAKAAGFGEGFSGHSGRVGLAIRMTRNQAPVQAVQRQGRWSSSRMASRYTRNESAGEALRYL